MIRNLQHIGGHKGWTRREVLKSILGAIGTSSILGAAHIPKIFAAGPRTKMMVLGIDGMDPNLLRHYMARGKMPNARKLAELGGFCPLATSMPPQSPVA